MRANSDSEKKPNYNKCIAAVHGLKGIKRITIPCDLVLVDPIYLRVSDLFRAILTFSLGSRFSACSIVFILACLWPPSVQITGKFLHEYSH